MKWLMLLVGILISFVLFTFGFIYIDQANEILLPYRLYYYYDLIAYQAEIELTRAFILNSFGIIILVISIYRFFFGRWSKVRYDKIIVPTYYE